MHQTGYKSAIPFAQRLSYSGGFCKWWFTPWENIESWPAVDPATQYLFNEPALITDATWFGPIKVPNTLLGFEEQQQLDKAGIFYKQKVSGIYPGDSGNSRVNLENLPYDRFAIVGKMRAGGLYLLLGNDEYGLEFLHNYKTGTGAGATAGSEFSFGYDSLCKAQVLTSFLGDPVTPPDDGDCDCDEGGSGAGGNNVEIIPFTNEDVVTISWNDIRKQKFGAYPLIEVWFDETGDGGNRHLADVPISVNAFPPDTTTFTVNTSGIATGIIVIK